MKLHHQAFLFPNGNLAVFNNQQEQVPTLQKNLLILWAEYAEREGFDPTGVSINGWQIIRTTDGTWNVREGHL